MQQPGVHEFTVTATQESTSTVSVLLGHGDGTFDAKLDAQVAARANTPPNIAQGMQILGAPDAQGRRPFSVSGTL